jgi:hypothetical protein
MPIGVSVFVFQNVLPFVCRGQIPLNSMPSISVFKIPCCFVCRGQIPLDKRISSGSQDMIWTLNLDEEKSKYAGLAQENGFGSE